MIFKIHYGLWYGGLVGIIPFMFNYASEYSSASGTQHGILYTVLPFVALLAKPAICSVADKYALHHHCLLFFILTTVLGYGSLAIYPFFPDLVNNHKDLVWILYCFAALVGNTSMCIVNSIGDSLAINSGQRKGISYGEYRLWGPVGFGIFGAIWGIANEIPSMPKYTPGIITMVIILLVNSLLLAFWYDKEEFKVLHHVEPQVIDYGSTTIQQREDEGGDVMEVVPKVRRASLLWKLAKQHNSIFAYIFIFTFCGIMTGVHWQFFFKYLEQISKKDNQSFSIVATLAIPVQALGGELVFFMLSGAIMKKLGASLTLVLCLFSFAARYLLYAYLIPNVNVYWILLIELLQGPAFGLMYSVLTYQANYYSEKIDELDSRLKNSLHATLQGVLGATFEGLGLGLGAIIGGRAYDVAPVLMWQIAGYSALAVSILCLIVTIITGSQTSSPSTYNANDSTNDYTDQEETAITELRNSGRRRQIDNKTANGEVRSNLDDLLEKGVIENGENGVNNNMCGPDETAIEELLKIARRCQSENKPSMSEVRANLEDLAEKLKNKKEG